MSNLINFKFERTLTMKEFKPVKEGKVREIYDIGDNLIMVATDRISAFDVILKNKITRRELFSHRCLSSGSITQRILFQITW